MAEGLAVPIRRLAGPATKLSRSMHGIRYDEVNDEFVVTNPFAQAILTFRGGATGNEAPLRVLQGPLTQLQYPNSGVDVDAVHDELYVAESNRVLVFPRTADGDVPPIRVIRGPKTQIKTWLRTLAVDPINNVLIVTSDEEEERGARILIFDRTAHGDVEPRGIIEGPKTGIVSAVRYVRVYPPKRLLIATIGGNSPGEEDLEGIAVWSIDDSGDVPPLWLLATGVGRHAKVVLNPEAKEVITTGGGGIRTFYFPEIF